MRSYDDFDEYDGYEGPNSKFIRGYLIYIAIFAAIALGVMVFLWIKLANYQANAEAEEVSENMHSIEVEGGFADESEELRAQRVFTDYISSLDASGFTNLYFANHPERLDSVEDVNTVVTDKIINPGFDSYKARDFSMDVPKYVIMSNGETLGEFTLTKNGSDWSMGTSELLIGGDNKLTIRVPAGKTVTVNGHELLEEYVDTTEEVYELYAYEEALENPAVIKTYTINGLITAESEVIVDGASLTCDGTYYDFAPSGDETRGKAEDFVKALLHYFAMGKENTSGNQGAALSYVASGSNASKVIHETASGLEWVGANYSLSYTTETSEPMRLSDNCYFIDVSYHLTDSSKAAVEPTEDEHSNGVYRVFFLDSGKGYAIVEFAGF